MQKLVLKVGSAVLTQDSKIAHKRLDRLVEFIVELKKKYKDNLFKITRRYVR